METKTLLEYVKGGLSEKERRDVAAWIGESEENLKEYQALRRLYDITLWRPDSSAHAQRKVRNWRRAFWAAASVAVLILGGVALFHRADDGRAEPLAQTLKVPAGRELNLELADGTQVWLNAGSRLSFGTDRKERRVYLEGEGFFRVTPDADRPFIVDTYGHSIRVTGTEFNIKSWEDARAWEVSLVKGSVDILNREEKVVTALTPGKRISLKGHGLVVSRVDANDLVWKDGILSFENETLDGILKRLSDYYGVRFDTSGLKTGQKRFTGKFRSQAGYEHILKSLQMVHGDFSYDFPKGVEGNLVRVY